MLIKSQKQRGVSLIELMVGLVLGLIVSAAAINAYISSVKGQADNIQLVRLNQDMRAIMDLMARDIRRSSYATSDPENNFDCLKSNPFNNLAVLTAGTSTVANPGTCILFAYNIDDDLDFPGTGVCTIENSDRFGYRVSNGVLQMKSSGGTEADCSAGTWQTINGSDVTVAATFALVESELDITELFADSDRVCAVGEDCNGCDSGNACLTIRKVTISLTGTLTDGTSQTITEQVRVRNDEFEETH